MALGVHTTVEAYSPQNPTPIPSPRAGRGAVGGVGLFANSLSQPKTQLQQGQQLYQNGQFLQAVNVWQAAAADFQSRGDTLNQALVLSYLSLTYQQLGQPQPAKAAIDEALSLINKSPLPNSQSPNFTLAQILNNQGQLEFIQGNPETALSTWQKSATLYKELGDSVGEIGSQINQARALQALGFYRRARVVLEQVEATFTKQPDSQLKAAVFLNLGNILRVVGDFPASAKNLQRSLEVAQRLQSASDIQVAWLGLGNLAAARGQHETALKFYQRASGENSPVKLSAQIHQLETLVELNSRAEAQKLAAEIQSHLANLPKSQTTIYAQIQLADNLVKLDPDIISPAAKLLAAAEQQAKILGNLRAQSYALGCLGKLYEKTQQWTEAKRLTQQALQLAQQIRAPEIAYQWQWQMGRLLKAEGREQRALSREQGAGGQGGKGEPLTVNNYAEAIAAYTEAVNILQSLRQDLVAINQDVQFSFQESVEPVYRELVDLLLQESSNTSPDASQKNLAAAQATMEKLQLAELANFFREACIDTQPKPIEGIDPTAAVLYPIILRDRLEVILSLPDKSLRHYATPLPQQQIEEIISRMRQSMRRTSFASERLPLAQQLYTWLVQPAVADLARYQIKTLVFVLDGPLQNLPMAALSDGKQYLIEQYNLAISPGLQLFQSRPLTRTQLKVLVAGLTQGSQDFSPLPGVQQEAQAIIAQVPGTILLDSQFTTELLKAKVSTQPFTAIHLATHGQFSSQIDETFILTSNGRLDIQELNTLLATRNLPDLPPIELLVLSACQTALGDKRAVLGLAGVAVRSGARSTLASLWTVNDESTAQLMAQFYQELLKPGVTKAEAVRRAQLQLLKQPEFNHPYHWAPFILVGNWR